MSTIFSKIIKREIPGHFIYEDDICVAIMDKFPAVEGQSMVILKREVDYIFSVDDTEYEHVFKVAKKIALASDQALSTKRTCLVVEGFEVPHVHIKLYPIKEIEGGTSLAALTQQTREATDAELATVASRIKDSLQAHSPF
jgi:histidine triad (HIT) family protein